MIPYAYIIKEMIEERKKIMNLKDGTKIRIKEKDPAGETTVDDRCWD